METDTLEALVKSVTILFVLSLAVERIAEFLKSRDWQPLSNLSSAKRVNLRTGRARTIKDVTAVQKVREMMTFPGRRSSEAPAAKEGDKNVERTASDPTDAMTLEERRRVERAAHAENTMLIGVGLAFLTGANAFDGLAASQTMWVSGAWPYVQIGLTGAAAGVGSSFWYDMLRLLTEVRRAKEEVAKAKSIDVPPLLQPGTKRQPKRG